MNNDILTVNQTAEYLQVCDKTIRRMIAKNELPASKVGKAWRIQRIDIEKYLERTRNNEGSDTDF